MQVLVAVRVQARAQVRGRVRGRVRPGRGGAAHLSMLSWRQRRDCAHGHFALTSRSICHRHGWLIDWFAHAAAAARAGLVMT
jgi:hypothetical protein